MKSLKAGLVGCGHISDIYLQNARKFPSFEIVACTDLNEEAAQQKAVDYNIAKVCSREEMMNDRDIDFIINLTPPAVHAEVALEALHAGKHVYSEKPISISREDASQVLQTAKDKGLHVGNAPDTFLGGGLQTCRNLIDQGLIGRPVSATAFMMIPGHESWHPNPGFYYQKGGGPMFDMGPYYLTALVFLMGPVVRVTGSAKTTYSERTITSQPKSGQKIQVEIPTQINGVLDFKNGGVASIITSFDTWHHQLPPIEIYGTEGSLSVPDPNHFGGKVQIRRFDEQEWRDQPLTHGFTENSRGLGAAEFAQAIMNGESPRASGELALHVLDIMQGIHDASQQEKHYRIQSSCEQPKALPQGLEMENFVSMLHH
ncbi:Gfo/Idh/MocA family protein [Halobacillus massiliensis]|uniref:Gfo/Idh/MocA family protein n=1 Tax=Halobacillus massiliensis TaxID=1926286 RepID=UPI0009E32D50|nr:Gfo/Idh/MocA family oxidoreductase [Halobacillus massiliensis]